ncbi:MAG: hypothetical protein ACJZ8E_05270 [Pseudohongiellaceae bacterium]
MKQIIGMLFRRFGSYLTLAVLGFFPASLYSQTAASFDINRYSTFGEGFFETFYIDETLSLQSAVNGELVSEATQLLVTETESGNLALIRDQMAFHHIAQGDSNGIAWMATF